MGESQLIVTLSSTVPCTLSGYPNLLFLNGQGSIVSSQFVDGGTLGTVQSVAEVQLSANVLAAFLIEYSGRSGCQSVAQLALNLSIRRLGDILVDMS